MMLNCLTRVLATLKIAEKKKIKNEFNWLPPDQEDWIVVLEKCVE